MAFGFDPSIILSARRSSQQADPLGSARSMADLLRARQGMQIQREQHQQTLASLLQKQQRERRLSEIFSKNAGNPAGVAQALTGAGFGQEALDWTERSAQARKAFQEGLRQQAEFIGRPFRAGVKSQADVDAAFAALERAGMAPEQLAGLPREYNEQTAPMFERLAALGMSTEDAAKLAQRDEELASRSSDRAAQRAMLLLLGRERAGRQDAAVERSEAKDQRETVTNVSKAIDPKALGFFTQLDKVQRLIAKHGGTPPGVGRVVGRLPSEMQSPDAIELRKYADQMFAAYKNLVSGAAVSVQEEANLLKASIDKAASPADFMAGLEALTNAYDAQVRAKLAGYPPEAVDTYIDRVPEFERFRDLGGGSKRGRVGASAPSGLSPEEAAELQALEAEGF